MSASSYAARVRRPARWAKLLWTGLVVALGSGFVVRPAHAVNFSMGSASARPAWSGFWWPMLDSLNPNAFDNPGPLLKLGQATGNYNAYFWENTYHKTTNPAATWWGHCNGWAAACVMEREARFPVPQGAVSFSTGDIKYFLTECHNADWVDWFKGARWDMGADANTDLRAKDFLVGVDYFMWWLRESLICNIARQPQVWNYTTDTFQMTGTTDPFQPAVTHLTVKLTFVDDGVAPNFVGRQPFDKTYQLWVRNSTGGHPLYWWTIVDAGWEGASGFDHPQFQWHPGGQQSSNPYMNYAYVKQLLAASAP